MYYNYHKNNYLRTPVCTELCSFNVPGQPDARWFRPNLVRDGFQNVISLHNHAELELEYVVRGRIHILLDDEPIILSPGDLMILNPYDTHYGNIEAGEAVEYYYAIIDLHYFAGCCGGIVSDLLGEVSLCRRFFPQQNDVSQTDIGGQMRALCGCYNRALREKSAGADCALTGSVCTLLGSLLDRFPPDTAHTHGRHAPNIKFIDRVVTYIEANYTKELTTGSVAAALSYNKSYFCTLFKQNFGSTFSNYLTAFRINRAASWSGFGDLPLSEIASRVGFSDYCYFSRSFKKQTGLSPSEYFYGK